MRSKPNLFKNKIRISKKIRDLLLKMPKNLSSKEMKLLRRLINLNIVVLEGDLKAVPLSLSEATYCKKCIANDFMIPGIEFDSSGLCPMCQTEEETKEFKSILPIKNVIPKTDDAKYDIALFYTGGKDSSYLLYYLVKVLNLRVLSLTWDIPYMSKSAKLSIENAKKLLPEVDFLIKKIPDEDLRKVYRKLYELEGNNCACPSLAYAMFYEYLVDNKVPYIVLGNEPVQILNLYYNHLAPKAAFNMKTHLFINILVNFTRVLTLKKPLKLGQFHTLMTMKQIAYGDSVFKRLSNYNNSLVSHVSEAIKEIDYVLPSFKKAIRRSSISGNIPAFIHIDFNDTLGGTYDWHKVKNLITNELGWVPPEKQDKGLHTSCDIEACKENSQFRNFYNMKSKIIPFSAIEISLASKSKMLSRDKALEELNNHMGFSLDEVKACNLMKEYMKKD
jgi:hypothetical protein